MDWSEDLHRFGDTWDQGRRSQSITSRTLESDDLGITSAFEGGNGCDMQRIGPDHYFVRCEPDPGEHGFSAKSYYFCFALLNRRPTMRRITVRVEAKGWDYFGLQSQHYVMRRGDRWRECGAEFCRPVCADNERDTVDLDVVLPGGTEKDALVVISNFHWNRNSEMVAWLESIADSPSARQVRIGESHAGRPLTAVEIGENPDAPNIVIAQTSQPSELAAALVIRAQVQHLLQDTAHVRSLRERLYFRFVPMPNPDGNRAGLMVSDPQGRFPGHVAHQVAAGDTETPSETRAQWAYLSGRPPAVYLEWHSNNWSRRPGNMLLRYHHSLIDDAPRRRMWIDLEDALLALPDTYHENFTTRTEGHYRGTMGYQTAVHLGAISTRMKTHEKYPLDRSIPHGIASLELVARHVLRG